MIHLNLWHMLTTKQLSSGDSHLQLEIYMVGCLHIQSRGELSRSTVITLEWLLLLKQTLMSNFSKIARWLITQSLGQTNTCTPCLKNKHRPFTQKFRILLQFPAHLLQHFVGSVQWSWASHQSVLWRGHPTRMGTSRFTPNQDSRWNKHWRSCYRWLIENENKYQVRQNTLQAQLNIRTSGQLRMLRVIWWATSWSLWEWEKHRCHGDSWRTPPIMST